MDDAEETGQGLMAVRGLPWGRKERERRERQKRDVIKCKDRWGGIWRITWVIWNGKMKGMDEGN